MPRCCARRSTAPRSCATPTWWDRALASRLRQTRHRLARRLQRASAQGREHERAAPDHAAHRRARRRRRRRAHQLDRRRRRSGGLPGADDLDPRRRPAHRRHHLLHRDFPGAGGASSPASGRCWRSRPASATSTSRWRANCWKPAARWRTASSRRSARIVIASTSRFYAMDEKIAMGDGRFDQDKLIKTIDDNARDALLIDMDALAKQSGSIINAVMLGAIAGCGRLPLDGRAARSRDPRRRQIGRRQSARLPRRARGRARESCRRPSRPSKKRNAPATPDLLEHEVAVFAAGAGAADRASKASAG